MWCFNRDVTITITGGLNGLTLRLWLRPQLWDMSPVVSWASGGTGINHMTSWSSARTLQAVGVGRASLWPLTQGHGRKDGCLSDSWLSLGAGSGIWCDGADCRSAGLNLKWSLSVQWIFGPFHVCSNTPSVSVCVVGWLWRIWMKHLKVTQ